MAAPTVASSAASVWNTTTTPKTLTVNIQSGDIIVVKGTAESNIAFSTPTNDGSALTWTPRQQTDTASTCRVAIFTAVGDSTRTLIISVANAGGAHFGVAANVWRGSNGVGNSNAVAGDTTADFSVGVTTTQIDSALDVIAGDFAAIGGARTYLTTGVGSFSEQTNFDDADQYAVQQGYHANVGATAAKTVGQSAPTGQTLSLAVVEVKGSTAAGALTGSSTITEIVGITAAGIPTRKGASVIAEVFGATSTGHSVQAALIIADSVDGAWTDQGGGTNLTAAIDEATANTSDYIRSELTPQDSGCRVKLATLGVPSSTSNHFVRWSIAKDVASGDTINMTVKLYQGGGNSQGAGTLIASFSRNNVSETFTTYSETLSSGQVASISNYADLYLEFFADTA